LSFEILEEIREAFGISLTFHQELESIKPLSTDTTLHKSDKAGETDSGVFVGWSAGELSIATRSGVVVQHPGMKEEKNRC
jgi:hypothetical protein